MKAIVRKFSNNQQATLDEYLISIFNEKKWNVEIFKEETSLNRDYYSKIKNNQKNKFKKITLIKILIGLELPKNERDYLLELNETQLSIHNLDDALYSFILDSKIDIDTADQLLKDLGKDGFIEKN